MEFLCRDAALDFSQFHALDAACFPPPLQTERQFAGRIAGDFWTARAEDGRLAGFLNAGPRAGRYHVSLLMVAPEFRRRGLAAGLLARAAARARELGQTRLSLHVDEANAAALSVYRRFGFRPTGRRQHSFALPLSAPLLRKAAPLLVERQEGESRFAYPVRLWAAGRPLGGGSFHEEIGAVKDLVVADAPRRLPGALAALAPLCRAGAEALRIRTADDPTAAACAALGLQAEGASFDMEVSLREMKTDITIARERLSAAAYIDFLRRTDLGSQYPKERFAARIEKLVQSVPISLTARDADGRLVGVCFAITDFAYWLFITDLGVDRDCVHQGIGKRLLERALAEAGGRDDIIMYTCANKNAVGFYEKQGMRFASDVMVYNQVEWTEFTVE